MKNNKPFSALGFLDSVAGDDGRFLMSSCLLKQIKIERWVNAGCLVCKTNLGVLHCPINQKPRSCQNKYN
jgi:hypothetical protein